MELSPLCKPTRTFQALAKVHQRRYEKEIAADTACWFYQRKYDGKYHQIKVRGDHYSHLTSGGKELILPEIEVIVRQHFAAHTNFDLHLEFVGAAEGHMGDRHCNTDQTTWLANQRKGIDNLVNLARWVVFDIQTFEPTAKAKPIPLRYVSRRALLERSLHPITFLTATLGTGMARATAMSYTQALLLAESDRKNGWEGGVIYHESHTDFDTPRSPYKLKLKAPKKAQGVVLEILEGQGKSSNSAGVLLLSTDVGTVRVGTGWGVKQADSWWKRRDTLVGYTVHYTYESKNNGTPQQCVYTKGLPV